MSDNTLRPDLLNGPYPLSPELWPGPIEGRVLRLRRSMRANLARFSGGRRRLLADINRLGDRFARDSDDELLAVAATLRNSLYRNGLIADLIPEALALVREVSWRALGKRPYDVQVIGAHAMLNGELIEMATGEGKTLTAALTASTAAMAGIPVHVMTANDYLSARDREILQPMYDWLGISSAVIVDRSKETERTVAYRADVVHATSQQFAFDYLRDRIQSRGVSGRLQMQHLVASDILWHRPSSLRMRGLCLALVDEADSLLIDEAKTPLVISQTRDGEADSDYFNELIAFAGELAMPEHFVVDARRNALRLTAAGHAIVARQSEMRGRYWLRKERDAAVLLALRAIHLLHRNRDYLVREGGIEIIDPMTGRPMPDRSWENGLHQFVEAKEGCEITPQRDALAKITYQSFFKRYLMLAGMSGTLHESRRELGQVYGLHIRKIPRHKPSRRSSVRLSLFATSTAKRRAFLEDLRTQYERGRPVLIGTNTVAVSEEVSGWLTDAGFSHRVLNAQQNQDEAVIVGSAGRAGSIVIATNMAGRGTDIPLDDGVAALGGLHVINLSLNESARTDRQLYGRAGRQGDPGSAACFLSLEDRELAGFYPRWVHWFVRNGVLPSWLARGLVRLPQFLNEQRAYRQRMALISLRKHKRTVLSFAGRAE